MPNPILRIDGFDSAIENDKTIGSSKGGAMISNADIFSREGELRSGIRSERNNDADVTGLIKKIVQFKGGSSTLLYGFSEFALWARISGNWRKLKTISSLSGLEVFGQALFYTHGQNKVGRTIDAELDGAITAGDTTITLDDATNFLNSDTIVIGNEVITYAGKSGNDLTGCVRGVNNTTASSHNNGKSVLGFVDNYQDLTILSTIPVERPMHLFPPFLYIGNGRYVAKIESDEFATPIFTAEALTLPGSYVVTCFDDLGSSLTIGTDRIYNGSKSNEAVVYFWDTTSESYNLRLDADTDGCQALYNLDNSLYLIAGRTLDLFRYNGSEWDKVFSYFDKLEIDIYDQGEGFVFDGGMTELGGNLLIGLYANFNNKNGVYEYGRSRSGKRFSLVRKHTVDDNNISGIQIGAVYVESPERIFYAWSDNSSNHGIDSTNTTPKYYEADDIVDRRTFMETNKYEIQSSGFESLLTGVKVIARPLSGTQSVEVFYKINNESSYTSIGSIDSSNQHKVLYGIQKRAETIQVKLVFNNTADPSSDPIRITNIEIY